MTITNIEEAPLYFNDLSPEDQNMYMNLKAYLLKFKNNNLKNKDPIKFNFILKMIENFINCRTEDQNKRFLVCGLAWTHGLVAFNIRQMSKLTGLCKTNINCGLNSIGFQTIKTSMENTYAFLRLFPFMQGRINEMKQWSMRAPLRIEKTRKPPKEKEEKEIQSPKSKLPQKKRTLTPFKIISHFC